MLAVYAALAGNVAVAVSKFIAAAITGSSAMLTEGFHSLSDTGNSILLLVGTYASRRRADELHPFGHGKELYFYTMLVAVLIFGIGGGVSIYEGILHVLSPATLREANANYIVIGIAVLAEGSSWLLAMKSFLRAKGRRTTWQAVHTSKDPTTFAVLFEDSAALIGLAVAALGIFLSEHFGMRRLDGAASIAIGLLLFGVAVVLLRESKGLLIGEAAAPAVVDAIRSTAQDDPAVAAIGRIMTMHLGPEDILLNVDIEFRPWLTGQQIATAIDRLERAIRTAEPRVRHIFIEAEALATAGRQMTDRRPAPGDVPRSA